MATATEDTKARAATHAAVQTQADQLAAERTQLVAAIGDEDQLVADVLSLISESILARAWAAGDVEFGRLSHCVTGRPGVPASLPSLVIETAMDWTGAKTSRHKRLAGLLADARAVPEVQVYKRYVQEIQVAPDRWELLGHDDPHGRETRWTTIVIDRAEAVRMLPLRVRLTDKGLAQA